MTLKEKYVNNASQWTPISLVSVTVSQRTKTVFKLT